MPAMRGGGNSFALAFTGLMRHDAVVPRCGDRDASGDLMARRDRGRTRAWRERCSQQWQCRGASADAEIRCRGDASRACLGSAPVRRAAHASTGPVDGGLLHDMQSATLPSACDQLMPRTVSVMRATRVPDHETLARFEQAVLPHLAAAYNVARWLTRDEHDAADVVQDAYVRALTFFDSFHGGDSRAWLLTIVRHTCYTWLRRHRGHELATAFDDERHSGEREASNPERLLLQRADRQTLREALEALPVEYREVMVLRELEGLSYKEIAGIADLPLGTVMSRLARARKRLQTWLADRLQREV